MTTQDKKHKLPHQHEAAHTPESKFERKINSLPENTIKANPKNIRFISSEKTENKIPNPEINHIELNQALEIVIKKYNKAVAEAKHHALEHTHQHNQAFQHHLNELRMELMRLEKSHHKTTESDAEKKSHFFNHHVEAMQHANEQWFHAKHHFELMLEAVMEEELEALEELHQHITHLLQEMLREKYEAAEKAEKAAKEAEKSALHPHPEPPHPDDDHES